MTLRQTSKLESKRQPSPPPPLRKQRPQRESTISSSDQFIAYIESFHLERPGITERILSRSLNHGMNPYEWLADEVDDAADVVDLGCGSAPMATLHKGNYVGVDFSAKELAMANPKRHGTFVRANATRLPLATNAFTAAVSSMALMVIGYHREVATELSRILQPKSTISLLLPAKSPVNGRDALVYALTKAAVQTLSFATPSSGKTQTILDIYSQFAIVPTARERRRFVFKLHDDGDRSDFVSSWYLPGVPDSATRRAVAILRHLRIPEIGIPLERVLLTFDPDRSPTAPQ